MLAAGHKRSRELEYEEVFEDVENADTKRSKESADGSGAGSSWNPALRWGD